MFCHVSYYFFINAIQSQVWKASKLIDFSRGNRNWLLWLSVFSLNEDETGIGKEEEGGFLRVKVGTCKLSSAISAFSVQYTSVYLTQNKEIKLSEMLLARAFSPTSLKYLISYWEMISKIVFLRSWFLLNKSCETQAIRLFASWLSCTFCNCEIHALFRRCRKTYFGVDEDELIF